MVMQSWFAPEALSSAVGHKLSVAPMSLRSSMMLCIFVTPFVDAKVIHLRK